MEPSAALTDATVVLDDRAILRNVSLDFAPGLTVIRGANGAGKTTLLRALAGLVPLARGTRETSESPVLVGHRASLLRALTPRENLAFFVAFRELPARHVDEALLGWGLASIADRPLERLSAGQRRRAALARLDAERVGIALLDEPFGELDEEGMTLVRTAIGRWRDDGRIMVVATHGHPELDSRARVLRIDGGAVTEG